MFSRSGNPLLIFLQSYHVQVTSKIQVDFRFNRYSGVLVTSGHLPVQEVFEVTQTFVPWQKCSNFISSRTKVAGWSHDQRLNIVNFIVISRHVMSGHVTSCHVMSCHIMPRHVTSCSRPVTSCHFMSRHVTSCHVMSRQVTSCHVMSRRKSRDGHTIKRFIVNWLFPHAINSN